MLKTPFTEITGCEVPIQLAGMPGINTKELAAAVSNSGGLGMISGTHMESKFLTKTIDDLKKLTDKPFGINFLMPFLYRACVEVAASKSRVVEFFYGEPDSSLIEIVNDGGALACWQIGSMKEATLAEKAGCDLIVAQGTEAGGHVRGDIELLPLLLEVLDSVSVPVIAAGGLGTAGDIAKALEAGAAAVRVGTRFLAAKESGAHHRVLKSCVQEVNLFEGEIVGERDLAGVKKPVPKGSIALPTIDTTGKIEAMALYAGKSVGAINSVESAAEIINELVQEI